jgi:glycosyltransferase involved in cell wall biosynthesis
METTIVIVVYKTLIEHSKTFRSFKEAIGGKNGLLEDISLVIYDNSPEEQYVDKLQIEGLEVTYKHDPRNLGIATAYNYAWSIAVGNGSKWLLLLDHDTELTISYVDQILNLPEFPSEVAAIVPKIISENKIISPVYSHSLRPLQEKRPLKGLQELPVMAINSGSIISMNFLNEVEGFNEKFPLDYLDHWLFYEIYATCRKVWLLDVTLEHELSVMDYSRVSLQRYQSILDSEIYFYKDYKKDLYPSYRMQLVKRLLKQLLVVKNKKIAMYTLKRLFTM